MKAGYSKIGSINPTEPIIKNLRIMDYIFNYNSVDLNNATLKYWFDKIQHVEYEDGKRKGENFSPTIDFSISADDENQKTYSFDFMVNMDINILNKMPDKPTNINKYVVQGEVFFANPDTKGIEFMDFYEEENIYHFTPSFWVQKLEDKKIAFKVQYQNLFIWFHVDFK